MPGVPDINSSDDIDRPVRVEILKRLSTIESEQAVTVLYACESGAVPGGSLHRIPTTTSGFCMSMIGTGTCPSTSSGGGM